MEQDILITYDPETTEYVLWINHDPLTCERFPSLFACLTTATQVMDANDDTVASFSRAALGQAREDVAASDEARPRLTVTLHKVLELLSTGGATMLRPLRPVDELHQTLMRRYVKRETKK